MPTSLDPARPRSWLIAAAAVASLALLAGAWWFTGDRASDETPSETDAGPAAVSVIVSGDTAGWIVPCGCAANQSGGLPRRGTFVAAERERAAVVVVDAGGAPGGTSPYQKTKFEAILRGELLLGLSAHNLGGPEASLGPEYLRRVARDLNVPFVSANIRDAEGQPVAPPVRIVEAGPWRLAFVGVLSPRYSTSELQVSDPHAAVLAALEPIRGRYDSLIVLAYLPEDELRRLAERLPEADAVVGGPTGQSIAPVSLGGRLTASATNKGKFLVQLSAPSEADTDSRPQWTGRAVEMAADFADDPRQQANLRAFRDELARQDFSADETGFGPSLAGNVNIDLKLPADYRVAGTESCRSCHADDCAAWDESGHAHAWQTLRDDSRAHVDPYCQQCHTTGYGLPGGFRSLRDAPRRVNVGCESCHGPSAAHVRDATVRTPFTARDQCVSCHDRENSPHFEFASYWDQIRHGSAPSETAGDQ